LIDRWYDGRLKLYLIRQALRFRRDHADVFHQGEFVPLQTSGCHSQNVVAFLRRTAQAAVLVAVPRWLTQVGREGSPNPANPDWCDTRINLPSDAPRKWASVLSNSHTESQMREGTACIMSKDIFHEFPVALYRA
jgi:(1->4)-alpha-D-glucan 1-alpha-D-glucosylmutase